MVIAPKPLEPGWRLRILRNAAILFWRNPIGNAFAFGPAIFCALMIDSFAALVLAVMFAMIAATIAAMQADARQGESLFAPYRHLIRQSALLRIVASVFLLSMYWHFASVWSRPLYQHGGFPGRVFGATMLVVFSMFMVWGASVGRNVLQWLRSRLDSASGGWKYDGIGMFNELLIYDFGLERKHASDLNHQATQKNPGAKYEIGYFAMLTALILPLILIVPGVVYCAYREMFFGPGIHPEKQRTLARRLAVQ